MTSAAAAILDQQFQALADPIRRGILDRLRRGEATVSELARPFPVSPPAISHHLKVLESARLISRRKRGREHVCRLRPATLRSADAWLEQYRLFWGPRLDALDDHLAGDGR